MSWIKKNLWKIMIVTGVILFLIYDTEPDNFGSGEKSRFITQLETEYTSSVIRNYIF